MVNICTEFHHNFNITPIIYYLSMLQYNNTVGKDVNHHEKLAKCNNNRFACIYLGTKYVVVFFFVTSELVVHSY